MISTDYQKQATDFLAKHKITFSATLIGNDCPPFCEDAEKRIDMDKVTTFPRRTHIHGAHYRISLSKQSTTASKVPEKVRLILDFWNSYRDEEDNAAARKVNRNARSIVTPVPYDVLTAITKSDPGTFKDFCGDFGYSTDSIRARDTYEAVKDEYFRALKFFGEEALTEAQEIQ